MFPTIKLYPEEVNFHCVPLGSTSQATLIIHNISNMVVEFQWLWLQKSIDIVNLHHVTTSWVTNQASSPSCSFL